MSAARFPFPDRPRLWGVAVSHYQVEGNDPCDWTEWEAAGRTRGESCQAAVGGWDLYESDADLAAAYPYFSDEIEWHGHRARLGAGTQMRPVAA